MRSIVSIIQVSDKTWYLAIQLTDDKDVPIQNTLIPFERYIYALHAAQQLQLHVDEIKEYQWVA